MEATQQSYGTSRYPYNYRTTINPYPLVAFVINLTCNYNNTSPTFSGLVSVWNLLLILHPTPPPPPLHLSTVDCESPMIDTTLTAVPRKITPASPTLQKGSAKIQKKTNPQTDCRVA